MNKGIDISSNNGVLDWDKIKAAGIDYAIIRVGYGSDEVSQDDVQAIRNMQECERLGIPYGVYLYSYCLNMDQARSEAAHALRMIKGFNPVLGVWLDMEDADGYKAKHGLIPEQNGVLLTDFCIEFMQIVKDEGYKTGVYANWNYFNNILDDSRLTAFEGFNRWLAHWGIDEPSMDCLLWQYTSDGVVEGSSERTDMNYYYGELPSIEPEPTPQPEQPDTDTQYHEGDFVEYDKIYASSTSEEPLTPSAGFTSGTITRVIPGAANPYLINDGTGWINDECINSADNGNQPSEPDTSINVGDKVRVLVNATYDGGSFVMYYDEYDVIEVKGDRAVIGIVKDWNDDGSIGDYDVTCAINICNVERV
jgi:GH25 family lysozyme M1 (1,4-beta-N-acetylmuramidase)|nr:MAG TPA_asm: PlyB like endolysin [Caudoviricetes sp.]